MSLTSETCRAARGLLGWSQEDLAEAAGISRKPLADFERGARDLSERMLADVDAALRRGGVEFIAENGGGAGVRLRKPKRRGK